MRGAGASPGRPLRAREALGAAGLERLDAEVLLARVLGCERARLVVDDPSLSPAQAERFAGLAERRREGEPVAYLVGRREFRWLELAVDSRVLIPRPETEHLVEAALGLPVRTRVVDVGTGSGAVALALKSERPDLELVGVDVSGDALEVARGNGERLGLDVEWVEGDLLAPVSGPIDAIVANLPYVAAGETVAEGVRWEPSVAVWGGPDGLDLMRRLVTQAGVGRITPLLGGKTSPRGPGPVPFLALEVGATRAPEVAGLCQGAGYRWTETHRDLAGRDRVVVARA